VTGRHSLTCLVKCPRPLCLPRELQITFGAKDRDEEETAADAET